MTFLNRRQFLKCSAIASLALLPCSLLSGRRAGASPVAPEDNYYLGHRKELTGAFQEVVRGASQFLEPDLGPERTGKIARDALPFRRAPAGASERGRTEEPHRLHCPHRRLVRGPLRSHARKRKKQPKMWEDLFMNLTGCSFNPCRKRRAVP